MVRFNELNHWLVNYLIVKRKNYKYGFEWKIQNYYKT